MTASDQGNATGTPGPALFRSHRGTRVVTSAFEDSGEVTATPERDAPSSEYVSQLGTMYAATFEGGETELWQFYEILAEARIFVLLDRDGDPEANEPKVFALKGANYILAFEAPDQADDLTGDHTQTSQALGMDIFKLLRGHGVGLALNMTGTSSATLISSDTVDMICAYYDGRAGEDLVPDADTSQFKALLTPKTFPDTLENAISERLYDLASRFSKALLLQAEYEGSRTGYLLAFADAEEADRSALVSVVEAAMREVGRSDIELDVAFLSDADPMAARIEKVGRLIEPKA